MRHFYLPLAFSSLKSKQMEAALATYLCIQDYLQNKYQIWKRSLFLFRALSGWGSCGGEPEARPVYISGTPGQLQRVREVSRLRVSEKRSCWGIELLKSHASGCPSCLRVGKNMYFRSLSIPTLCNAVKFYRIWLELLVPGNYRSFHELFSRPAWNNLCC